MQETFLKAHREFAQFVGSTEPELIAWLRQILVRDAGQPGQAAPGRRARLPPAGVARGDARPLEPGDPAGTGRRRSRRPARTPVRREQAVLLADALAKLPADYREVFILRNLEHIPFDEIAARMGRSPGAVRKLWTRAMVALRQLLEEIIMNHDRSRRRTRRRRRRRVRRCPRWRGCSTPTWPTSRRAEPADPEQAAGRAPGDRRAVAGLPGGHAPGGSMAGWRQPPSGSRRTGPAASPCRLGSSVLTTLDLGSGPPPRVHLHDLPDEDEPLVGRARPRCPHGRAWAGPGTSSRARSPAAAWGRSSRAATSTSAATWRSRCCWSRIRANTEVVRRFVEEAQIGGQLQHPGIVPVYELGTFPDRRPYFAMKLVKGGPWRRSGRSLAPTPSTGSDPPSRRPRSPSRRRPPASSASSSRSARRWPMPTRGA